MNTEDGLQKLRDDLWTLAAEVDELRETLGREQQVNSEQQMALREMMTRNYRDLEIGIFAIAAALVLILILLLGLKVELNGISWGLSVEVTVPLAGAITTTVFLYVKDALDRKKRK